MSNEPLPEGVIVVGPGQGRHYDCGPMQCRFLIDGDENDRRYSASVWHVAAGNPGPGPHAHEENEEVFFVIDGMMTFLVGDQYIDASAGTFLRIPAGVTHDFENRSSQGAAVLNVFMPGGFEDLMPDIVQWFRDNPTWSGAGSQR